VFGIGVACFVVTKGLEIPPVFREEAERTQTPLLRTRLRSSVFIERISRYLADCLAPVTRLHGVLVDVMEVGILLVGRSGIGKSECAMDLVLRSHRLVADDVVQVRLIPPFRLVGRGEGLIRYHMEIRGLGILNIQDLFGISAIRDEKELELVIELVPWKDGEPYDRLGFDERTYAILGVDVPYLRVPVAPGRNISSVVEVAARNHLLKRMGHHSAIRFRERLHAAIEGEEV
jgi:HPr kinase/phosphorylase